MRGEGVNCFRKLTPFYYDNVLKKEGRMPPKAIPPTPPVVPADAGAPRVELSRTMNGSTTWRIVAPAVDGSEDAMAAAVEVAVNTHRRLKEAGKPAVSAESD